MFVHKISFPYHFELSDKYFEMSYPMDIPITNICIRDILGISSFQSATGPCCLGSLARLPLRFGLPLPSLLHSSPLLCAAPQSQPLTGPPERVCPAQTATASLSPPSFRVPLPLSTPPSIRLPLPPSTPLPPPPPIAIFVRSINIPGTAWTCLHRASPCSAEGGCATRSSCAHSGPHRDPPPRGWRSPGASAATAAAAGRGAGGDCGGRHGGSGCGESLDSDRSSG